MKQQVKAVESHQGGGLYVFTVEYTDPTDETRESYVGEVDTDPDIIGDPIGSLAPDEAALAELKAFYAAYGRIERKAQAQMKALQKQIDAASRRAARKGANR